MMATQTATTVRQTAQRAEWFASWFDSFHYHKLYAHRDDAEAARFLDALTARLEPPSGARVLDLGCGAGRHSRYLASKGLDVTGMDLAAASASPSFRSRISSAYSRLTGSASRPSTATTPWARTM